MNGTLWNVPWNIMKQRISCMHCSIFVILLFSLQLFKVIMINTDPFLKAQKTIHYDYHVRLCPQIPTHIHTTSNYVSCASSDSLPVHDVLFHTVKRHEYRLQSQTFQLLILALALISYITFHKLYNLSETQFLPLNSGILLKKYFEKL